MGVLTRAGTTEWGFPTFIIPKKDGRVHWVGDFRELNKLICRKIYPLPCSQDILQRHPGCTQLTKMDISMQF